jgi:hypothetical protein
MDYTSHLIRKFKYVTLFASVAIWVLYVYFKLSEFIEAALSLKYITVQTVSFVLYSVLLVFLPATAIFLPRFLRKSFLKWVCFCLSAVVMVGAIGDLFTYNFFRDYTFFRGDAIFCNILLGIPNLYGTICCILISLLYLFLGIHIMKNRGIACLLYLLIFLIGAAAPFIYSYTSWGGFPRHSWLLKAAFIIPHQACVLLALVFAFISKLLRTQLMKYESESNL